MLSQSQLDSLHTNQRLLVLELQQRGVELSLLDPDIELLEASLEGHHEFLLDRFSSAVPHTLTLISSDKYLAKYLLGRAGVSVPKGKIFDADQIDAALSYAEEMGYPVVLKPNWGSHGDKVFMNLRSAEELRSAISIMLKDVEKDESAFFVEEQFTGHEYRIFVTQNGEYAAVHRDPAHVIGDGERNIRQLAEEESHRRMNPRTTCLCPIALDHMVEHHLNQLGKTLDSIPAAGEKIYLRLASNVAQGGTCDDVTDLIHPSAIEIAKRCLEVYKGLPFAGIDFMSSNITIAQTPGLYRVLEVNPNPGFAMHMKPGNGTPRNVASWVADITFPETRKK